jgi:hypothetical protein
MHKPFPFVDYFDVQFAPSLGIRAATFRAVLREVEHMKSFNVVETGCTRIKDNWADGQSTIIWSSFATLMKSKFTTIDINEEAVRLVIDTCQLSDIAALCGDSVKVLRTLKDPIDILYLDSYDVDMDMPHKAALHSLKELVSAMPLLHSGSIVFVDDAPINKLMDIGGKGGYIAEYMKDIGATLFTFGYQAAWKLP